MRIHILVILTFLTFNSYCQGESTDPPKLNSIYLAHDFLLTLSINYERTFKLKEKVNLGLRGGLANNYGEKSFNTILGITTTFGRVKHFFEAQLGYEQPFYYSDVGPDPPIFAIMAGYRLEGSNGLLFKAYGEFVPDLFPEPDSWGHLPFIGLAIGKKF